MNRDQAFYYATIGFPCKTPNQWLAIFAVEMPDGDLATLSVYPEWRRQVPEQYQAYFEMVLDVIRKGCTSDAKQMMREVLNVNLAPAHVYTWGTCDEEELEYYRTYLMRDSGVPVQTTEYRRFGQRRTGLLRRAAKLLTSLGN